MNDRLLAPVDFTYSAFILPPPPQTFHGKSWCYETRDVRVESTLVTLCSLEDVRQLSSHEISASQASASKGRRRIDIFTFRRPEDTGWAETAKLITHRIRFHPGGIFPID